MADLLIVIDDPRAPDVRELLAAHLAFASDHSRPEDVHALDHEELDDPAVTFFGARRDGVLLGIGALKQLDETHGELKSMHTADAARGQGIGRAMVEHLVGEARRRGYRQVSLETGATEPFVPALTLYEGAGFTRCERFGDYPADRENTFMTLLLD